MRVRIYQINWDRDLYGTRYNSLEESRRLVREAAPGTAGFGNENAYDLVFDGDIKETAPEEIFERFNTGGHPLFRGRSLSVSDIIVMKDNAVYVEPVGFSPVAGFDEAKCRRPGNAIRAVYAEPGRPAYETSVSNTLQAMQEAVGGLIECVYNEDGTALVCNEEGKLLDLPANRRILGGRDIVAGPFLICGTTEEGDFRSLTDGETERYLKLYAVPESIPQDKVRDALVLEIMDGDWPEL